MIQHVSVQKDNFLLHSFRADDMERFDDLSADILELFNQKKTLCFLPHKKLHDIDQARLLLRHSLLTANVGLSQLNFITDLDLNKTVGLIEVISPVLAKDHYQLDTYPYFLEFCLTDKYTSKGLMSFFLPEFTKKLILAGITSLGAVASPKNIPAVRVLQKSGLKLKTSFDPFKNLYYNISLP